VLEVRAGVRGAADAIGIALANDFPANVKRPIDLGFHRQSCTVSSESYCRGESLVLIQVKELGDW